VDYLAAMTTETKADGITDCCPSLGLAEILFRMGSNWCIGAAWMGVPPEDNGSAVPCEVRCGHNGP